jgi:hypothetical protein
MNQDTPIIFSDGTAFFDDLAKTYSKHSVGYFILAPSGSGKSHYVNNQSTKNWIDGDYLWPSTNADLTDGTWSYGENTIHEVNRRSDVITYQAKKLGFWIIGSSNESLEPDAIVLPPWNIHTKYIENREKTSYDGGAVSKDLEAVKGHRNIISKWSLKNVPIFKSVEDAANYLAKSSQLFN